MTTTLRIINFEERVIQEEISFQVNMEVQISDCLIPRAVSHNEFSA
jgi:hypothetical protein